MGLDMYFYKLRKAKNKSLNELLDIQDKINYADNTQKQQEEKDKLLKEFKNYLHKHTYKYLRVSELKFDYELGYMRKANAIHNYIIDNFGGGIDDCTPIELSKENIKQLQDVVKRLIYECKLEKGKVVNGYSYNIENGQPKMQPNYEKGYTMTKTSKKLASKLLPTCEGFFFGSTQYDEWYYNDLLEFYKIASDLLKVDTDKYYMYYRASW